MDSFWQRNSTFALKSEIHRRNFVCLCRSWSQFWVFSGPASLIEKFLAWWNLDRLFSLMCWIFGLSFVSQRILETRSKWGSCFLLFRGYHFLRHYATLSSNDPGKAQSKGRVMVYAEIAYDVDCLDLRRCIRRRVTNAAVKALLDGLEFRQSCCWEFFCALAHCHSSSN